MCTQGMCSTELVVVIVMICYFKFTYLLDSQAAKPLHCHGSPCGKQLLRLGKSCTNSFSFLFDYQACYLCQVLM